MKAEYSKLGDILGQALRRYNFEETITQAQVKQAYEQVVGPMLTKLTYSLHFDPATHILHLRLASPALRQEYSYKISDLMRDINEKLSSPVVQRITLA